MEGNRLCVSCSLRPSDHFCICSGLPRLCSHCRVKHETQSGFHFILPIDAIHYVNQSNQVQYRVWLTALKSSQEMIRENVRLFEEIKAGVETHSENLRRELMEMTARVMRTLGEFERKMREKIEEAVQETTVNAYRADYQPTTYLASLIWTHCSYQSSDPISLFSYGLNTEVTVKDCLRVNFQTTIPDLEGFNFTSNLLHREPDEAKSSETELVLKEALPVKESSNTEVENKQEVIESKVSRKKPLVHVKSGQVRVFNLKNRKWVPVPLTGYGLKIGYDARYMWIETGLFCSGGMKLSRRVYLLTVGTEWIVTKLADMLCDRYCHGLWWDSHRHQALTFGGTYYPHTKVKKCEERRMPADAVSPLPDMKHVSLTQGLYNINPCEFHNCVYLKGDGSHFTEVFDLETRAFFSIQQQFLDQVRQCLMFVQDSELVILSRLYVTRFRAEQDNLVLVSQQSNLTVRVTSNMPPLVTSDYVYSVYAGTCYRIPVEGGYQEKIG